MSMYLSIIINEDTKFGMQMQSREPISKIIGILRGPKVIPPEVTDNNLTMLNGKREQISLLDPLQRLNCQARHNPKLLIFFPKQYYDHTLIASRLKEMKSGKVSSRQSSANNSGINDSSIGDKLAVYLKRIFEEIQRKNFSKISEIKEEGKISPSLVDIFFNFTTEYRKYWSLFEVYRQLSNLMQSGEDIEPMKFLTQIDKRYVLEKEDREDIIRKINQHRTKIEELQQNSQLKQKISILEMEISHLFMDNKSKEDQLMRLRNENSQVQFLLKGATDRQNQVEHQLKREINSLDDKLTKTTQEKKKLEELVANSNKQILTLKRKIQEKDQLLIAIEDFERMSKQVEHLEQQLKQVRYQVILKDAELVQLTNHYERFEQKLQKRTTMPISPPYQATATILNDFIDLSPLSSSELIFQIETNLKLRLINITPLFIYSKHGPEYFIKSLIDKPNLLLIARTAEGKIVGGFSSTPLSSRQIQSSEDSFLFHSQKQELFLIPIKKGRKCLTYDTDFLIFGQEELCIQQGSCWLQSQALDMTSDRLSFNWQQNQRAEFLELKKQQRKESNRFKKDIKEKPNQNNEKTQKVKRIKIEDYICLSLEFQNQQ